MADLPVVETTFTYVVLGSVPTLGFTLAVEPTRLEVNPGEAATYQVRISPIGDFFNRVHLEVVGWPVQYPAPSFHNYLRLLSAYSGPALSAGPPGCYSGNAVPRKVH